ncbi:MAG TPA: DEAD/DEAH box helicase [Azospirillaceae bacterium]|nr:DEAD/DEAH box helicase [Azospirillaceae bacterium]
MDILFSDLCLNDNILRAVEEVGYTSPTPIQAKAIPAVINGRDLIASANTGTGKTAAFVLPALHKLAEKPRADGSYGPRVLVLTPTRELASQVLEAVRAYSKYNRVWTGSILGGMPYRAQLDMLRRRIDVIVATPGRLIDHLERGTLDLSSVEMLVLDEADRMLDMGFLEPVEQIAAACPAERQTLLFTATVDRRMAKLASNLLKEPEHIDIAGGNVSVDAIDQRWLRADGLDHKHKMLDRLVNLPEVGKAIVFAATKRDADRLAEELTQKGHAAAALHGDMQQRDRNRTITALRQGRVRLLVATDVAARGIDIHDITHVINFDLPKQAEDYVHRIGRTGRAGATGTAWSMFTHAEWRTVKSIEAYTNTDAAVHVLEGLEPTERPRGPRPSNGPKRFGGPKRPFGERRFGGDRPQGDRPQGERKFSDRPAGERKFGDRPKEWDRPRGENRPQGDRPQGERKFGDRPHGDRPFKDRHAERPQGENRSHGGHHAERRPRPEAANDGGTAPLRRARRSAI